MAKRFKLKLSRVIPSFQFCRSKDPSSFPETPVPDIYRLSPVNPKAFDIGYPNYLPAPPPSTPDDSFVSRRHVTSNKTAVYCGCRKGSDKRLEDAGASPNWWNKEKSRFQVEAEAQESKLLDKVHEGSFSTESNADISPVFVGKYDKKQNEKKKNIKTNGPSSDMGWLISRKGGRGGGGEDAETETLISHSRSFSSYELDRSLEGKAEGFKPNKKNTNNIKVRRLRRQASVKHKEATSKTPAEGGLLRWIMPQTAEGKVKESVAVVKKSADPYEDFKRSMLEMILEKDMYETKELEQLLHCFLSLNSRQYHGVIIEAFSEIWEDLFL